MPPLISYYAEQIAQIIAILLRRNDGGLAGAWLNKRGGRGKSVWVLD